MDLGLQGGVATIEETLARCEELGASDTLALQADLTDRESVDGGSDS